MGVTSAIIALLILLGWSGMLAFGALEWSEGGITSVAAALGSLWLLLNFYAWMVPKWRTQIVTTRGPLLGFGFAFAGALVSSVVDATAIGTLAAVPLFLWRTVVLSVPFVFPLFRRLKPYPHWIDFAVLAFGWFLPFVPGFGGTWFALGDVAQPGLLGIGSQAGFRLGPGRLLGLALIATYFYGARAWTAAPLDWMYRHRDTVSAVRMAVAGVIGAVIAHFAAHAIGIQAGVSLAVVPAGPFVWAYALLGATLAPVAEELTFRGILLSGVPKVAPGGYVKWPLSAAVTAVLLSLLHAYAGSFALSTGAAFGLSVGISLTYTRANRLLPAIFAHAAAWAVLTIIGLRL